MREEVRMWWKQALKDLESAEKNLKIEEYYLTAFLCQQSVEKALKALYIHKLKTFPGVTHSLIYLGKKVGVPREFESILKKLTPDFVVARYPDVTQTAPYELYDKEIAEEKLKMAKKVIEWVEKELKT